jgi:iron complex outermembrane receptor protein
MFNLSNKATNWSLALALAAGIGATGNALPVLADDDEGMLEEVVVTGSRIRRTNADSPTPMTVLGSAQIDGVGTTNIGELLEKMPMAIASLNQSNATFSSTSAGLVTTSLRNLGQSRTLTLINGKRFVSGFNPGAGYAVDLSTIPVSMIDRVEIITGGASAVYGSDAVAGVVNIIMKDDFEGMSLDIRTGVTAESDREQTDVDLSLGANFDRGNAYLTFGYSDEEGIHGRDRSFSNRDLIEVDSNGDGVGDSQAFFGSSFPPGGRCGPVECDGSPFIDGHGQEALSSRFNRGSRRQLLIPIERKYARGGISYEINDDLTLAMTVGYNETFTASDIEPVPLDLNTDIFNTDTVPGGTGGLDIATSLVIPEATKAALLGAGFTDINQLGNSQTGRRLVEFGDRGSRADRTTMYADGTVTYNLNDDWSLEGYASWGRTRTSLISNGNFNVERARKALDVELVGGVIQCADASARQAGCVPFTPFGLGAIDAAQVTYLSASTTFNADVEQTVFGLVASGETPFELPGGRIGVAGGVEYRREQGYEAPSGLAQAGIISGNRILATSGEFDVTDYYVEARFPIIDQLTIEAAVRVGDYSTVGNLSTWKVGFEAPVLDWLKFRGTIADSVRAPNISDLFAGAGETFASVSDPCRGTAVQGGDTLAANCLSVPEIAARVAADANGQFTLTQTELQATGGLVGGNPNVQEETAESFTFGFIVDVPKVAGLSVAVDYYDIEIDDAISTTSRSIVVSRCYDVAAGFDPTCGGAVTRSNGALVQVNSGSGNENLFETDGIDVDLQYNTDLADLNDNLRGNLDVNLLWNILGDFDVTGLVAGDVDDRAGEVLYPDNRFTMTTSYSVDDLSIIWRMRFWDEVVDSNTPQNLDDNAAITIGGAPNFGISGFSESENDIDSVFYHDLRAAYDVNDNINVYFGIQNVLDEEPPRLLTQFSNYGSTGINTAPEAYDVIGRRYYAGVSVDL